LVARKKILAHEAEEAGVGVEEVEEAGEEEGVIEGGGTKRLSRPPQPLMTNKRG
jgi:hypothetical protein